tara:strand:- start:303 stop:1667 length:1365 start_codon:yes stop_codon:yes gene_type:complete
MNAQTIKLENYTPNMRICPNEETFLSFSARDAFNNKLAGKFVFALYINGNLDTTTQVHIGSSPWVNTNSPFQLPELTNLNLNVDNSNNKRANFFIGKTEIIQTNPPDTIFVDGLRQQSNDVQIVARFKDDIFSSWVEETFYFRFNVVPPGKAVVQGTNDLYFCSVNQIQTVTLPDYPSDSNNSDFCFWHHQWIWELPAGWKVTSTNGNLSSATNIYQGGKTVKIQAPSAFPTSASLNVRSQSVWPYPINTTTEINMNPAPLAASITYEDLGYMPIEICYEQTNDPGTFHVTLPVGTNAQSYYWETNAGTISNSTTTVPSVTINFNAGSAINRYLRVKTTNFCGTSNWKTFFFDMSHQPYGCSGSGGPMMMSVGTYPNPTSDEINIELTSKERPLRNATSERYQAYLINSELEVVRTLELNEKSTKMNVRDLPKGTYYLRVVSSGGSTTSQIVIK